LRSDKQLEGSKGFRIEVESGNDHDEGVTTWPSEDEPPEKNENEKFKEPKPSSLKRYLPPFPQRFAKVKFDSQFAKFLDVLKKLRVNIPFIDALSQIPMYDYEVLKEILSKKRKIDEHETIASGEECSVMVLNKLPTKLNDP